MDYYQIDLNSRNGSTLITLQKLEDEILDAYKFATITFENDCKQGLDHLKIVQNTRLKSRDIFRKQEYLMVLKDIHNRDPKGVYEDWYVHPDLVDMSYVGELMERNKKNYVNNIITQSSIDWKNIEYH